METQLILKKKHEIRTRYAPSPTGPLHIGGARTALFNYLLAKQKQGTFILRIEDTDVERSKKEWEKDILKSLKWLGIVWDEGPCTTAELNAGQANEIGDYGPYRQSERKKVYEKYLKKLYEDGFLYWCFCTKEELQAQKEDQLARGEAPRYLGKCQSLKENEIQKLKESGKRGVLRFKTPSKIIQIKDLIRGKIEFDTSLLGDFVVAKDLSTPLYNLAVVVDDFEMKITHIVRGEDHISNTPKQILLQEALGFFQPKYAHIPLILNKDRSKVSKRQGGLAINDFKKEGYLPEALVNFMVLLGWNPGTEQEMFSLEELIKVFSLERIQKGGAILNPERLNFVNGYYIRNMPLGDLAEKCIPFLIDAKLILEKKEASGIIGKYIIEETKELIDANYIKKIVSLFQERLKKLSEISEVADFFFKKDLKYDSKLLLWKDAKGEDIQKKLKLCYNLLKEINEENWNTETIKEILLKASEKLENRGVLLWPLRVALTGKEASPPPFEIADVLGKEKTLKRLEKAIDLFNNK
jgi:nondiscriminating glutamyl-tRNA synthetase